MFLFQEWTEQGFSLGRSTEITRDELKFTKFVQRLRKRFVFYRYSQNTVSFKRYCNSRRLVTNERTYTI